MLPGPSSRSTILDDEITLRRSSSSYHFALNTKLGFELCRTLGSNNLSLHHYFDLMSSPIDYIFMNSRDKGVVIINILSSSRISIEFMMRNTILALDELYYHRPLYCLPTNTSLFMFVVIPWVPCYPTYVIFYRGVLPSLMLRMLWGLLHLLRILAIMILLTITILSWSSCWFQPGYPQVNGVVWIMHF